jgi:hypothetical protein
MADGEARADLRAPSAQNDLLLIGRQVLKLHDRPVTPSFRRRGGNVYRTLIATILD